jgi:hypothetical protein
MYYNPPSPTLHKQHSNDDIKDKGIMFSVERIEWCDDVIGSVLYPSSGLPLYFVYNVSDFLEW